MFPVESRSEILNIRGLRYHVRHWGDPEAPPVFFLHGWMDSSPTFQFLVEALRQSWHVVAPDWRGYGASEWLGRPYWFHDYYGDLDGLLAHYSPEQPAQLVGHSMGGSIASMYAASRPERVARLAMLDFLGLKPPGPPDPPALIAQWLRDLGSRPRLRSYADHDALARYLMLANPRLSAERAAYLARHVGRQRPDGLVEMACDPWHKVPSPLPYRIEDVLACWQRIEAPVLQVVAEHGYVRQRFGDEPGEYQRRMASFRKLRVETIADAGHNLQHDQPERLAQVLEDFLARR